MAHDKPGSSTNQKDPDKLHDSILSMWRSVHILAADIITGSLTTEVTSQEACWSLSAVPNSP